MASQEQQSDTRRADILAGALKAFSEHGVARSSIGDIRHYSGASVGSIYHHFGSKDAIAAALYLEALSDYQLGFTEVLRSAETAEGGVKGAVQHHVTWIAEHPELARFLLTGREAGVVDAAEEHLHEQNRGFFRAVSDWVNPRVRGGELRALEPELMTSLWIGPCQDYARHWLAGRTRGSLNDAAEALADAAWRCMRP
jgi:AcrR family transcriptional regulator